MQTLYTTGLSNFLNVLEAQRASFNLQDSLAQSQGEVIISLIKLYKSLGGGWDVKQNITTD